MSFPSKNFFRISCCRFRRSTSSCQGNPVRNFLADMRTLTLFACRGEISLLSRDSQHIPRRQEQSTPHFQLNTPEILFHEYSPSARTHSLGSTSLNPTARTMTYLLNRRQGSSIRGFSRFRACEAV